MHTSQILEVSSTHSQITFQSPTLDPLPHFNFLGASGIDQKTLLSHGFCQIQDSPSKNLLHLNLQSKIAQNSTVNLCQSSMLNEDPLYSVLMLTRGKSQDFYLYEERQASNINSLPFPSSNNGESQLDEYIQHLEKPSDEVHQCLSTEALKGPQATKKRPSNTSSTKNITKNMGKLLLKWIWNNRQRLHQSLQQQDKVWEQFISKIKQWKKQNNLTRQYLSSKWHGSQPECRIFRIVSAHFYRRECLAAIAESNIEEKWIHLKKREKFLAGTTRANALDTLN